MWLIAAACGAAIALPAGWRAAGSIARKTLTEECWTGPRGGTARQRPQRRGGVLDSWEVMQIEMVETDDPAIDPLTFYGAGPAGRPRGGQQ